MNNSGVDKTRRQFLTNALTVVGAVGTGFVTVPFLSQMQPSVKAKASGAPVQVNLSRLEPGQLIRVEWRGKPVWILNRTEAALSTLAPLESELSDPNSAESLQPAAAQNSTRSLKPEIFVAIGLCTHLGCSPTYRPEIAPTDLGKDWQGGFFCPCHGSKFDIAGRVYSSMPAPTNLEIPPYRYIDDNTIVIGDNA
ncbi:MAG: ubiquinol-cytochrome c reductase iron-sulfur subunit [Methylococcales bacterium]|jgi:ubiquinol-cytochrome c reductase iron-sulfur subunit|nr:ubiquinol-cytochrome c reductase iron-sulfur subunit [Methylococcales bacterium]